MLLKLADALKSPIVHALGGKEYVEWDNPYDVGMTGLIGFASGYYAMNDCDALLLLGDARQALRGERIAQHERACGGEDVLDLGEGNERDERHATRLGHGRVSERP